MNRSNEHISATELVRNLSGIIDRVRMNRTPITITKGNQAVAQIVPVLSSRMTLADLSQLLKVDRLNRAQKQSFQKDIDAMTEQEVIPKSSWE
jgi:prevent-host-death family protein